MSVSDCHFLHWLQLHLKSVVCCRSKAAVCKCKTHNHSELRTVTGLSLAVTVGRQPVRWKPQLRLMQLSGQVGLSQDVSCGTEMMLKVFLNEREEAHTWQVIHVDRSAVTTVQASNQGRQA